ncbi:radial spoke head protein 9 homolog isoform X3 [Diabrotica undecimpunctata]|uniref:radial spoke head protein 9 homolog isoform X3 n=1 Tax=Diabrotica undecimpunctata TaxID=50387 RepID=UPI003B639D14
MEDNIEIKKGFTEYDQPCIESHLWTSVDLQDLKVEPEKGDLAKEVKVKKEEEFAEDDQKYIENHLWTSTDLQDLKAEPEENESGEPSMIIEIVLEQDETLIGGRRKQSEIRKLKEEDRLASTVYLIMEESAVIPRAGIFRQPDGVVVNNLGFEGLQLLDAREWSSFLHLRVPTRKQNTNLLTRDDYNYATDFLDPIDNDIPEGCWMIQTTQSEDLVILKSMYWPGLIFFHNLKTPKHGFIYFGHGKKCLDVPFMLSPFFT